MSTPPPRHNVHSSTGNGASVPTIMNGAFTFNVGNTSGSPKTRGPTGSNPRRHRSPAVTGFIPSSSAPPAFGNSHAQPSPGFGPATGPAPAFGPVMGFGLAMDPAQPSSGFGPATGPAPAFGPVTGFGLAMDLAHPSSGFGPAMGPASAFGPATGFGLATGPAPAFGNSPAQPSLGLNGPATGPPLAFGNSPGLNGQGKPPRPCRYVKFPTNQGVAALPNKAAPSLSINTKPAPGDNAKRGVDDMIKGVA